MKKILIAGILLSCITTSSFAQTPWVTVGGPSGPLGAFDIQGGAPSAPPVNNVIIDNKVGIGVPYTFVDANPYPLIVSGGSSGSIPTAIWLHDFSDNYRNILCNSTNSGLHIFSGTNFTNGTTLNMYAKSAPNTATAPGTYPTSSGTTVPTYPGMMQTISYGTGNVLGFQHVAFNSSTNKYTDVFHITSNGDEQLTGNLYMAYLGDANYRNIDAVSSFYGLKLASNTSNSDGTAIEMHSTGEATQQGFMQLTANSTISNTAPFYPHAFNLQTYTGTVGHNYSMNLTIDKTGNARFGDNWPTSSERLTIDGDFYLYTLSTATSYAKQRNIFTHSTDGGLNLVTNNDFQYGADGPVLSLFANSSTTSPVGALQLTSSGSATGNPAGFIYRNATGGTAENNIFLIGKNGQGIFGTNVALSNITGTDVFTVQNNLGFYSPGDASNNNINGNTTNHALVISAKTGATNGPSIEMYGNNYTSSGKPGRMQLLGYGSTGIGIEFLNYNPSTSSFATNMGITNTGQVFIGPESMALPTGYNLYVANGILTEKLRVATQTGGYWSDFVFAKDYKLKTLKQVESYVKENKHLPDVPSAKEVEKDGIDVATMDAKLLQKIEELTLYVIQQQKEIEELKKHVNK